MQLVSWTAKAAYLCIAVMASPQISSSQFLPQAPSNAAAGNPSHGFVLSVTPNRQTIPIGSDAIFTVEIRSVGSGPQHIFFGAGGTLVTIKVTDTSGQVVERGMLHPSGVVGGSSTGLTISQQQSYVTHYKLSEFTTLTQPGTYRIEFQSNQIYQMPGFHRIGAVSNSVTVTVK